ncbi:MAG: uroporphyrinogen-III C-methyltransferase [Actinomycetota bacterium]
MPPPPAFLLAWCLGGRHAVVVGGGMIGTAKVEIMLGAGAELTVIDPSPSARCDDLAAAGRITLRRRRFRPWDVRRAAFVVAATGDRSVNTRVRRWAKRFGAVVNVVDDPALCDVTFPSVVRRGPVSVAISTAGASPALSRFMREELGAALPTGIAHIADHAALARTEIREAGTYREDYVAWRQGFFEPALAAARAGRPGAVDELRRRFVAEFGGAPTPIRAGRVTLVGAGPGGSDLVTVRGANALARADVVLYDRLADPALLELAPPAAAKIPVGKSKGTGVAQSEIHGLLVEHAHAGRHVVRLKGGDPFVFGRGGEEADALAQRGVEVEVVPGLSSALAGPALAGISLTERLSASSFVVLSGHHVAEADPDLSVHARSRATLVVMMAASTAAEVARVVAAHRGDDEPVAFVHRAGRADQQVAVSTLGRVVSDGCPFASPSVMVVGEVVTADRVVSGVEALVEPVEDGPTQERVGVVHRRLAV